MKGNIYKAIEFLILFILLPVSLSLAYPVWIKAFMILFGFIYVLFILFRVEMISFKNKYRLEWRVYCTRIGLLFLLIVVITTSYVLIIDPSSLFCVIHSKPKLWVLIVLVYTILSVWPQELVYRTFFFVRYEEFFQNRPFFLFVNAVIFSLGHIFFRNILVVVLTFIGGLLFAYTYYKTRSTIQTSIEHALYGSWLFTVGMGEMLAFPGVEQC